MRSSARNGNTTEHFFSPAKRGSPVCDRFFWHRRTLSATLFFRRSAVKAWLVKRSYGGCAREYALERASAWHGPIAFWYRKTSARGNSTLRSYQT